MSALVFWQVQTRATKADKWVEKATFETRASAQRAAKVYLLTMNMGAIAKDKASGQGSTRIVRVVKEKK